MRTLFYLALKLNNTYRVFIGQRSYNTYGFINAMELHIPYRVWIRPTSAALAARIALC